MNNPLSFLNTIINYHYDKSNFSPLKKEALGSLSFQHLIQFSRYIFHLFVIIKIHVDCTFTYTIRIYTNNAFTYLVKIHIRKNPYK